jgi:hypothetical protein
MKKDDTVIIVIISILALFLLGGFGIMGFGNHGMMGGYGSTRLCSTVGGIWCYWPNWTFVFNMVIGILVTTILVLLIVLLVKRINADGGKR